MDELTKKVQHLYTRFPLPNLALPEVPDAEQLDRLGPMYRLDYNFYFCTPYYKSFEGAKMLDAGCGTGNSTFRYVVKNPQVDILGAELSPKSVFLAEQRVKERGMTNVRFRQVDLMDPAGLADEGPFDFIASEGVIHHLSDPATGLRNLSARLTPDGFIFLGLYTVKSRHRVIHFREAIKMLLTEDEHNDVSQGIKVARALLDGLAARSQLEPEIVDFTRLDQGIADAFLHFKDEAYTLDSLFELLDSADLELVRFFPEDIWLPRHWMHDPELLSRAEALPRRDQYRLAEYIMPMHVMYQFFARPKSYRVEFEPLSESELAEAVPCLVPFVHLESRHEWKQGSGFEPGAGAKLAFNDKNDVLKDLPLDEFEHQLIRAIDGKRTLAQALEVVGASGNGEKGSLQQAIGSIRRLEQGKAIYFQRVAGAR